MNITNMSPLFWVVAIALLFGGLGILINPIITLIFNIYSSHKTTNDKITTDQRIKRLNYNTKLIEFLKKIIADAVFMDFEAYMRTIADPKKINFASALEDRIEKVSTMVYDSLEEDIFEYDTMLDESYWMHMIVNLVTSNYTRLFHDAVNNMEKEIE